MRLFELLLLFSNAVTFILLLLQAPRYRLAAALGSGTGLLAFAIHGMVEGLRWQMALSYALTLLFCCLALYRFKQQFRVSKKTRFVWIAVSVMGVLALSLTALLSYALPVPKLPAPTGIYPVGTQTFQWTDMGRKDPYAADPGENRELLVQVWYPADVKEKNTTTPLLTADERHMFAQRIGIPALLLDYLKFIPSHAAENAEVSAARQQYPLIIFNHGYTASRLYHTSQAAEMASHGFIVASIDHTYGAYATLFPDGTVKPFQLDDDQFVHTETYRNQAGEVWSEDISFVIDQFERLDRIPTASRLDGKVDMSSIGVIGHSFGGAASYDAMLDPRVRAGINMDGTLFGFKDHAATAKPFLFMYSEDAQEAFDLFRRAYSFTDEEFKEIGTTRAEFETEAETNLLEMKHIQDVMNDKGEAVYIAGTGHLNYSDLHFASPVLKYFGLMGKLNPDRTAEIVNQTTVQFFRQHLAKGQSGDEGPIVAMPELRDMTDFFTSAPHMIR
ncbi:putative dienelactone hydrolase [Paenibacillus phyllosphaerae]|uniref:Putative dienelactone hydrolase n=1 Tax=Paenibacillus phyllosphaerae TaxID=274593 RepID=A0A7W5B4U6_9BACL|nr:hypothetical protein [Paenibacillus phyllosphaerae]MBB3113941.1 putative dienelactone hydrolase [Paenibacillus phyllosphaerae]